MRERRFQAKYRLKMRELRQGFKKQLAESEQSCDAREMLWKKEKSDNAQTLKKKQSQAEDICASKYKVDVAQKAQIKNELKAEKDQVTKELKMEKDMATREQDSLLAEMKKKEENWNKQRKLLMKETLKTKGVSADMATKERHLQLLEQLVLHLHNRLTGETTAYDNSNQDAIVEELLKHYEGEMKESQIANAQPEGESQVASQEPKSNSQNE